MSVILSPPLPAEDPKVKERYWTAEEFYRAADAGVFDDPGRLELIHGRIIERMPQSPLHATLAAHIAECLRGALLLRFSVREERAIHIAFDGDPVPDISVVTGRNLDYRNRHPTPGESFLLVEVAISSVESDTGGKALLYAQAGIDDYWVVLPETNEIWVHRQPSERGYQQVTRLEPRDTVSPLAASDAVFSVGMLLGQQEN